MSQLQTVLEKRIFAEGETTWEQVCDRVAKALSDSDAEYAEFYEVLANKTFLPNSPCLKTAGLTNQLFACFVLPIEDSMDSIFGTLHDAMLIQKAGGGTGFSFNRLRGKGEPVGKHGGVSSGIIPFLKTYDTATESVKQGGYRKGANMGVLNIDHPDIWDFITCKTDQNAINNFNLSIGMTDKFMANPNEKLLDKIVDQIWLNGEPGVLFLDEINRKHKEITGIYEEIEATNPCGEQPLLPYECCCLGSLNLAKPLREDTIKTAVKC
jgi:ribonucleoside-diphosphate reductase alpha chain